MQADYIDWTRNKYRRYRDIHGKDIDPIYDYLLQVAKEGYIWRFVAMDDVTYAEKFLIEQLFKEYKTIQRYESKEEQRKLNEILYGK